MVTSRLTSVVIAFAAVLSIARSAMAAVSETEFGKTPDGTAVQLYTLTNEHGASLKVMTYGATIVSIVMPDRDGKLDDVVLGFDGLSGYLRRNPFFGCIVGRYGNRISKASFELNGVQYKLTANDHGNILHGGRRGFDKVIWTGSKIDDQTIEMSYLSKDGEEGFPGNLSARVRYSLSDANELKIEYFATTDKDTIVNLTNHSYFNLSGAGSGDVLKHELTIDADGYLPTDPAGIPSGKIAAVADTPFDFRTPHPVGERISADDEQIKSINGYDHNFVLTKKDGLRLAATLHDPATGRTMQILSTEPGIQFYSGNGLGGITGKNGKTYIRRGGLCLEPQHFPDSPNHPEFPSTVLKPGQTYHTTSIYRFTAR